MNSKEPSHPKIIDKREMKRLVSRNLFSTIFSNVINLFVRLFLPPIILHFVSLEEYGIWTICFTLITYLNLSAVGVTNVYVRYVAEYHAKEEIPKISGLLSTGIILVTSISLLSLTLFWYLLDPLVQTIFRIPPELQHTATVLFFSTACILMFQMSIGGAFMRMLNGLQKISETTSVFILGLFLEASLSVLLLFNGFGIYALLYAQVVRYLVSTLAYIIMSYQAVPGLSISPKNFDTAYFKVFYRFGAIVQVAGIIGTFLNTVDKLITSSFLGMQATALLGLGARFPVMAVTIPSSMTAVYLPATTYMYGQQRHQEMIQLYIEGSRTIGLITGFLMGFLAAFASPIIVAWLGTKPEFQIVATILTIYTLSQHLHVLTGPGSSYFKGIDNPANNLIYSFSRLTFTTIIVLTGLYFFGTTLITITTTITIATSLSALLYLTSNNHRIGVPQLTFLTKAILPSLVPYGIAYLLLWPLTPYVTMAMTDRWNAIGLVLISGMVYTLITGLIIYGLIFTTDEKTRLHQFVQQRLQRLIQKIKPSKPS